MYVHTFINFAQNVTLISTVFNVRDCKVQLINKEYFKIIVLALYNTRLVNKPTVSVLNKFKISKGKILSKKLKHYWVLLQKNFEKKNNNLYSNIKK